MIARTALGPLARSASASARLYSTRATTSTSTTRRFALASIAVLAGTAAYAVARPSALAESYPKAAYDEPSLKENIHKKKDRLKTSNRRRKEEHSYSTEWISHIRMSKIELILSIAEEASVAKKTPQIVKEKEEESSDASQGAFNEETGEINWECPCLGGMAHGPCGEDFKAAFSCFVFSEAEPKGMDCVDKFKLMQDCFRAHPDVYGEEIEDEEVSEPGPSPLPNPDRKPSSNPSGNPPENSPVLGVTPETTPTKSVSKIATGNNTL
ncbi:hypothetical protein BCR39DRAFT_509853 [Naematelia encephala]|uniref:Mitochondrial intermembrane space import and assembly protein 40 n=1 Tax=Naematelia encephala TaxID=71784 RepID=A0A1Y2BL07_9TREE|nr:hypothetical protein BCR39DRAFT_509853 [Naematelia encephala]